MRCCLILHSFGNVFVDFKHCSYYYVAWINKTNACKCLDHMPCCLGWLESESIALTEREKRGESLSYRSGRQGFRIIIRQCDLLFDVTCTDSIDRDGVRDRTERTYYYSLHEAGHWLRLTLRAEWLTWPVRAGMKYRFVRPFLSKWSNCSGTHRQWECKMHLQWMHTHIISFINPGTYLAECFWWGHSVADHFFIRANCSGIYIQVCSLR